MNFWKSIFTVIILFVPYVCHSQIVQSERLLSFEEKEVPSFISGKQSDLKISDKHYKDGQNSLQWTFEPNATLSIKRDLKFEKKDPSGIDTYLSTFIIWIYNENPIDDFIQFEFLKDGRKYTSFPFRINYSGWRAAWVCYERDMAGSPEEGMNEIRITAPDVKGSLYIDHLLTAAKMDRRHQTADQQVPFVNAETNSHWLVVLKRSLLKPDIQLENVVSSEQRKEINEIESRFRELIYIPSLFKDKDMQDIRQIYLKYDIKYTDGKISGLPIFFSRAAEAYERLIPNWDKNMITQQGIEVKDYFDFMNRVATGYNNAKDADIKEELKNIFLKLYDHITDQGFVYGSCLGNFTHYGYSFRNLYTAYFLMKDVLSLSGKLEQARQTMQWYAMTNEVYLKPSMSGMDIDSFNTVTSGRMASILIMNDSPEKVQYLKSFSRWIDNGCLPAPGLAGSFKSDGAIFHHCNNYPAYAVGGLTGATDMIYVLSNTEFSVSEIAHQTVKNSLLTMRFYCNKKHFPLSMSGRHPDGRGQLVPIHFARMAMAGTPNKQKVTDEEMAAAFLRLSGDDSNSDIPEYVPKTLNRTEKSIYESLVKKDIKAEENPRGNIALGYGCISVQRRSNWAAVVRGHSRYLWAAEHYVGANLYGRYLAHGSLQIMTAKSNETVTPTTSGWQQEGFDWGRIPGTTAIHLPVEQLKANILNVDTYSGFEEMLYSDEAFAGGISQRKENGAFGMKLHEHDKYNGSHRARKSYHFFDNKIICLGTDIENNNANYNTETTIFQLAVTEKDNNYYRNDNLLKDNYIVDHIGTGYYIPSKKNKDYIRFEKNSPQYSRKQNTGEETEGNWVSLTIDHGKAPKGKSYEYIVIPGTDENAMKIFAKKPDYKVLRQDRNAHIVKDIISNTTSFVVFETLDRLKEGIIEKVDTACLIMLKQDKQQTILTVCNPDLALYRGASDEALDENGKRTERSIYSRPWKDNESKEIPVKITLKDKWNIKETPNCKVLSSTKEETVLQFTCKEGKSYDVEISK